MRLILLALLSLTFTSESLGQQSSTTRPISPDELRLPVRPQSGPDYPHIPVNLAASEVTSVSGAASGTQRRIITPFFRTVNVTEYRDVPCQISISGNEPFLDDASPLWAHDNSLSWVRECAANLRTGEVWSLEIPYRHAITGLQACYNRSSGRLKGVRLFYDEDPSSASRSHIQPNCSGNRARWADRVECPDTTGAFGLIVHFEERPRDRSNPIIGLQLVCGPYGGASSAQVAGTDQTHVPVDWDNASLTDGVSGVWGENQAQLVAPHFRLVRIWERRDVPCTFGIEGDTPQLRADLSFFPPASLVHGVNWYDDCADGPQNDTWWAVIPEQTSIIGLQACFNRQSGRLKGLRLFHDGLPNGGSVSEVQPNCRGDRADWAERIDCAAGQGAFGLVAHTQQRTRNRSNAIIGLQLICGPMAAYQQMSR